MLCAVPIQKLLIKDASDIPHQRRRIMHIAAWGVLKAAAACHWHKLWRCSSLGVDAWQVLSQLVVYHDFGASVLSDPFWS
jgi:hypothetical protein